MLKINISELYKRVISSEKKHYKGMFNNIIILYLCITVSVYKNRPYTMNYIQVIIHTIWIMINVNITQIMYFPNNLTYKLYVI